MNTVDKSKNHGSRPAKQGGESLGATLGWPAHASGKPWSTTGLSIWMPAARIVDRDQARQKIGAGHAGSALRYSQRRYLWRRYRFAVAFCGGIFGTAQVTGGRGAGGRSGMRTAPGKQRGYIICPILIPPDADPETWLSTSDYGGWLAGNWGKILLARCVPTMPALKRI